MTMNNAFYSRQVWHCVFGIHNFGTCEVVMHINHESKGTGTSQLSFMMVVQDKIKIA
jgi:hypothetical protein